MELEKFNFKDWIGFILCSFIAIVAPPIVAALGIWRIPVNVECQKMRHVLCGICLVTWALPVVYFIWFGWSSVSSFTMMLSTFFFGVLWGISFMMLLIMISLTMLATKAISKDT